MIFSAGSKGGKSPKPQKPAKQGKQKTTWDPFTFGGAGAKGQEAAELDRSSKDKGRNGEKQNDNSEPTDHQLHQFVPDLTVRGKSSQLEGILPKNLNKAIYNFSVFPTTKSITMQFNFIMCYIQFRT